MSDVVVGWLLSPVISWLVTDLIKKSIIYLGSDITKDLEDLETTVLPELLITIQAVQQSSPNRQDQVAKWLERLKNAYNDAKDILHNEHDKEHHKKSSKKKLLPQLNELKKIAAESKNLRDLLGIPGNNHPTTSSIPFHPVFGHDSSLEDIITFLLAEQGNSSSRQNYSVAAITGVEGAGKTTLAQYVYNDQRIKKHFSVRMWLPLTPNLDITERTKEMIEIASQKECPNLRNLDLLQKKLREALSESEKIMIVLDDVWYDSNNRLGEQQWGTLLAPFAFRGGICKIVVTSRSTVFPSALNPGKSIKLCGLARDDFKSLLQYHAIDGLQISNPQLMNDLSGLRDRRTIVEEIAEKMSKMGKQPLEAKVVGNYLCQQPDIKFWKDILKQIC